MSRKEIIMIIHRIMENQLELPAIASFHENARLNEDLYMDSILTLQLILHLEVDFGFDIPDEMLVPRDFRTVGSLASFLERLHQPALMEEGL